MSGLALERQAWLPQAPRGMGLGALLALLAHLGLIVALALGLNWRNSNDAQVMSAELWSAMPQWAVPTPDPVPTPAAAPTPVPKPAPPPVAAVPPEPDRVDAQIAIEKAERARAAERARLDADRIKAREIKDAKAREDKARADKAREDKALEDKARADKLREDKRQQSLAEQRDAQAAEARIARQRDENLKRMLGQASATGAPTTAAAATDGAARNASPSAAYAGRIKARIKPNILLTAEVPGNPVAEVEVKCAPDGTIVGRRIVKGSGNAAWDDTVLRAIDRTEVLPRDVDGRIPATMLLVFPRRE